MLEFAGAAIQGAMDLDKPQRILFEYPRAMIHLMEQHQPSFDSAFLIGHGIGTIAGYFAEHRLKVVEYNPKVLELSRQWFGYAGDNVTIGDGRTVLEGEAPQAFDYIVIDAFTEAGTPPHLTSEVFFELAADKLDERGAVLLNLMGRGEQDRLIRAIHTTLGTTFSYTKVFALPTGHTNDVLNIVMIGSNVPITFQARKMAGFTEIYPDPGHVIRDHSSSAADPSL